MKAKGFLHSMTCDRVDGEGNVGHWVAGPVEVEEEEEGTKWLAEPLAPKNSTFSSEEIGKRIFSLRTEVGGQRRRSTAQSSGRPRKKHRTESLDSSQ